MTSRFASNLLALLCGSALCCTALSMPLHAVSWIGFAAGGLLVAATLAASLSAGRGVVQRCFDAVFVLLAAWALIASRTFAGASLKWLMFSAGAGFVVLAAEALVAHEIVLELSLRRAARGEPSRVAAVEPSQPIRVAG